VRPRRRRRPWLRERGYEPIGRRANRARFREAQLAYLAREALETDLAAEAGLGLYEYRARRAVADHLGTAVVVFARVMDGVSAIAARISEDLPGVTVLPPPKDSP
jgi:hypothetical protein